MASATPLKIVIASAGRRAHYIDWFRSALRDQDIPGEVIAAEFRATSPSLAHADRSIRMPAYNSPEYAEHLRNWVRRERPDLFISLNDYEMKVLADGPADELRELGCIVAVLSPEAQAIVLDKFRMAQMLREHQVPTPATALASDTAELLASGPDAVVVKHRFGSGSSGLEFTDAAGLAAAVRRSAATALDADGRRISGDLTGVVVQPALPGDEFGIDGVFSLDGESRLLGVLARRKDQMRSGDTDVATTVDRARFTEHVRHIGEALRPYGAIDIDFRETADGEARVIDINPRLGGGYPFSHRAGADVPAALVRLAAGLDHDAALLDYEVGVTSARREEFTVIARG